MSRGFRRIVVTGDCLRADAGGPSLGAINTQTEWLFRLLRPQLRLATGLEPEVLLTGTDRGIDAAAFYADLGIHDPLRGWPRVYSDPSLVPAVVEAFRPHLQGAVCIGFELPEYLRTALDRLDVPYIDLWVHPVRFLDDLMLAVGSSHPKADRAVGRYSLSEDVVWATAGLRQATAVHLPRPDLPDGTLLIAGQAMHDKSQIWRGEFFDPTPHAATVAGWASGYSAVVIKPHPVAREHPLLTLAAKLFPAAATVDGTVYTYLADDRVAGLGAVNSSAAEEARYFGKRTHTLIPPVLRTCYRERPVTGAYHSILDSFLEPDFWRATLGPFFRVTRADGFRIPPKANRLRVALNSFWGFNKIDSDLVVEKYAPAAPTPMAAKRTPVVGDRPVSIGSVMGARPGAAMRQCGGFRLLGRGESGIAVYGPYNDLPAGDYQLSFSCRVLRRYRPHPELFECRVSSTHHRDTPLPVVSVPSEGSDDGADFRRTCRVTLPINIRECEFVLVHPAAADVWIDRIELARLG